MGPLEGFHGLAVTRSTNVGEMAQPEVAKFLIAPFIAVIPKCAISTARNGQDLTEYSNQYCKKTSYLDRSIGSRGITLPAGSRFEVLLELGREFQLHGAHGVSVVTAFHPGHYEQQGIEFAQVFWIPLKTATFGSKYTFKHTIVWHEGTGKAKQVPFKIPAPAKRPQIATDNWLKEPVYQANHGCLSVHVQRGQVDLKAARERTDDFKSSRSNVEPRQNVFHSLTVPAHIIRLHWFFSKRGKHGEPYVFEYRNLHPQQADVTTAGELNFKDELLDFDATEEDTVSDAENGCEEFEPEEEEEESIDHRRTQSTDDGSPVKRMRKQRGRGRARKQVIYREIFSSSEEEEPSEEESSDEETEDEEDVVEEDLSPDDTAEQLSSTQDLLQILAVPNRPQASTKTGRSPKKATLPKSQRNVSNSKQIKRGSAGKGLPINTLSRLRIPPSSAIKRKLSDCDDEDEDDEEFLPQVKMEKFFVTKVNPLTPDQQSSGSSRDMPSGSSNSNRGNSSSKRARIERDLELLKIRKHELELLNKLDELEKEG
ncbi:hypothetical protein AC579_3871 [Pseudocercospora musae]|uniref:Uncharacterized protein n=1 Tax=Pseudocercospora musae TaxID=113226 RepID=A0A139IRF2_9PEZI|nr:hypothetical protein AC579_3871 [Pseudocercospora musae]